MFPNHTHCQRPYSVLLITDFVLNLMVETDITELIKFNMNH